MSEKFQLLQQRMQCREICCLNPTGIFWESVITLDLTFTELQKEVPNKKFKKLELKTKHTFFTESKKKKMKSAGLELNSSLVPWPCSCQLCGTGQVPPLSVPVSSAPHSWNGYCVNAVVWALYWCRKRKHSKANFPTTLMWWAFYPSHWRPW